VSPAGPVEETSPAVDEVKDKCPHCFVWSAVPGGVLEILCAHCDKTRGVHPVGATTSREDLARKAEESQAGHRRVCDSDDPDERRRSRSADWKRRHR
jgi:hypothetical protein